MNENEVLPITRKSVDLGNSDRVKIYECNHQILTQTKQLGRK
jgi:hypothetical protein